MMTNCISGIRLSARLSLGLNESGPKSYSSVFNFAAQAFSEAAVSKICPSSLAGIKIRPCSVVVLGYRRRSAEVLRFSEENHEFAGEKPKTENEQFLGR
jgi:hypothetical protein